MIVSHRFIKNFMFFLFLAGLSEKLVAQDDYEIQVYTSETAPKGHTLFELHSNYTLVGNKQYSGNIFPSDKILHETLEITHGFSDIFELGVYFFNAIGSNGRSGYGGSHIRPRIRIPESWNLPVGLVSDQKLVIREQDSLIITGYLRFTLSLINDLVSSFLL